MKSGFAIDFADGVGDLRQIGFGDALADVGPINLDEPLARKRFRAFENHGGEFEEGFGAGFRFCFSDRRQSDFGFFSSLFLEPERIESPLDLRGVEALARSALLGAGGCCPKGERRKGDRGSPA